MNSTVESAKTCVKCSDRLDWTYSTHDHNIYAVARCCNHTYIYKDIYQQEEKLNSIQVIAGCLAVAIAIVVGLSK